MPIYISNAEADELARELASKTGETITEVVVRALRDRRKRLNEPSREERIARLEAIAEHTSAIIGEHRIDFDALYDDLGAPK